ncbi:MAG: formyltransferase family protein [Dehalococcoidia bacterium]
MPQQPYRIGWFSTGNGEGSRNLLRFTWNSIIRGDLKAEIAFVFCNREPGEHKGSDEFMKLVHDYSLPLVCVSSKQFKQAGTGDWRSRFEEEVMSKLEPYSFDLGVLAGYMLIVGREMCKKYPMINLHPAPPDGPAGTWQEVIWQLIEKKAKETGAMTHLVTPVLDGGPVVSYCKFSIRGKPFDRYWDEIKGLPLWEIQKHEGERNPLFIEIRKQGAAREIPLVISTIKAFSEGKIKIDNGKVVDVKGKPIKGYDLSREIDKKVKEPPAP